MSSTGHMTPQGPQGPNPSKRGEPGQNIQVYVRVRPLNSDEMQAHSPSVVSCPTQRDVSIQEKPFSHITKTFNFDKVFCDISKQVDVYQTVVNPLIKQVLKGYNCTVFAYGQTGTGKTFTMEGLKDYNGSWEQDPDAGIIPRSLVEIFDARARGGFDKDNFQIKVSFLELYNEEIFDLLSSGMDLDRKHKIFEDSSKKGSVIVQGLEEIVVQSKESVLRILEEGSLKRQTAATKMNATSSRSHTIFSITVTITEKSIVGQEKYIEGKLNLVDLAGSENIGRSGAVDRRAREAGKINESLLTLGRVINSLVKRENHIPYRESKLTRLLQDSLGGRTKTSIIATISPASINMEETLSTLDYAHRAKNITNRPEVNQKIPVASKLAEMQAKVDQIRKELDEQRERDGGVFMSQEKKDEMEKKMLELEQIRKEFTDLSVLFSLKSADNDRLSGELSDTIQQLEEKSAILFKTQEEKEVQEHLVTRHAETEGKISRQAFELVEVADQQYSDLDKLQDVKERKSKLETQNTKAASQYQISSGEHYVQLNSLHEGRIETMSKMCDVFRGQREEIVKRNEEVMHKGVEEWAKTDGQVKEIMTNIDGLSAAHMHSEQTFLSQSMKKAQTTKDDETARLQTHLTVRLAQSQDEEEAIKKLQKTNDDALAGQRQFTSDTKGDHMTNMKRREDLLTATIGKQREHHSKDGTIREEMGKEIEELEELLLSYKTERDAVSDSIKALQTVVDSIDQKMTKASARVQLLSKRLRESGKETQQGMHVAEAAAKTMKQLETTEVLALEEAITRADAEMTDYHKDQVSTTNQLLKEVETGRDSERDFVLGSQEREKTRYEEVEVKFRERSDEAPKQLLQVQELTRQVQKLSSDSLRDFESRTESHTTDLQRWREDSGKDADVFCQQISSLDAKSREAMDQARERERKFFSDELRKDVPTGRTPARSLTEQRKYPREIVTGTPDEERVRRYRQGRDLGVAMRLQIGEGEEDESEEFENDSVISGSTNVTEGQTAPSSPKFETTEDVSSTAMESKDNSRSASTTNLSIAASEEVGYVSDRENRDPTFAHPGSSKLKQPKVYPASSAVSRTRSTSRSRNNVLGSAN